MKPKRLTIINPLYLVVLKSLRYQKFKGICANIRCNHQFTFKGTEIIKKMIPHIKHSKKRKEKRGSYHWIKHFVCGGCGNSFVWDFPIHIKLIDGKMKFTAKLKTMKYLGPFIKNKAGVV